MNVDLVKRFVFTQKADRLINKNDQCIFDVDVRLHKTQIKRLMEELFEIKIIAINTHRLPRKKKRVGAVQGYKTQYKRVIATLRKGESLDFSKQRSTLA